MRNLGIAITTIVASVLLAGTVFADTIHVPGDYQTIQGAVDASSDGDEIVVAPGTYTSTQDGHVVDMKGKAVTLRASGTPEETIIDGENARRGIACFTGETESTLIEGFTITNGNATYGGGIYCGSSPTITNCEITGNTATNGSGGGIHCHQSSPTITGCTISGNTAIGQGGGIYCWESNPTISGCMISGNIAGNWGGGISCANSNPTITNCTISDNTTTSGTYGGGGINCSGSNPTITGCTISGNTAVFNGGGIHCHQSNPTITGCTISDNMAHDGGGLYNSNSYPTLTNTIVCGNMPDQILGNSWIDNGGNTVDDVCPILPGACCTSNEIVCVPDVAEADCLIYGGQWLGEGSSCDDCPPPVEPEVLGACCLNGGCVPSTVEGCFAGGGSYAGDDVTCADAGCPEVCPGDLTGDNQVTIMDLLFVLDAWGVTCP